MKKRVVTIALSAVVLTACATAMAYYQNQPETELAEAGALTREEAVALATAHLVEIGLGESQLEYAYLTTEEGVEVWSIEFVGELEFYVTVATGEFLKAPNWVSQQATEPISDTAFDETAHGISREEASEIAQGLVSGRLIEVDTDVERGREVWYVAIADGNLVHEIYVDRQTGEVVLHETYEN